MTPSMNQDNTLISFSSINIEVRIRLALGMKNMLPVSTY